MHFIDFIFCLLKWRNWGVDEERVKNKKNFIYQPQFFFTQLYVMHWLGTAKGRTFWKDLQCLLSQCIN